MKSQTIVSLWQNISSQSSSQLKGKLGKKMRWVGREVMEMQRVAGREVFGSLAGGEEGKRRGEKQIPFF